MNKKMFLYGVLLLLLCGNSMIGAYGAADSLKQAIPAATDTFAYLRYLNDLSATLAQQDQAEQAVIYADQALALAKASSDEEGVALSLLQAGHAYNRKGNEQKALSRFVQTMKLQGSKRSRKLNEKLYYGLATTLARLKKYPLALKYFHKAAQQQEKYEEKKVQLSVVPEEDPARAEEELTDLKDSATAVDLYDNMLDLTEDNRLVVDKDTLMVDISSSRESRALLTADITDAFDDGKKAIAYGLLLHIKQPVAGKRKPFTGINNVGHTFITLTKFNADSGYVSRTFGFYPDKDYLLSATPLLPASTSVFKDDEGHDWDEIVARFISRRKFNRILRMVKRYSRSRYNLNKNNCTDFGLVIAGIAGITIQDTRGTWPLGGGNNPADTGQSVREGKIEQSEGDRLFIYPLPENGL